MVFSSEIILRMVASSSELVEAPRTVGAKGISVGMSILADRADWGWFCGSLAQYR